MQLSTCQPTGIPEMNQAFRSNQAQLVSGGIYPFPFSPFIACYWTDPNPLIHVKVLSLSEWFCSGSGLQSEEAVPGKCIFACGR